MSLVYLALRKSGTWTSVIKSRATMPPFVMLDGPYDFRVAQFILKERNRTSGPRKNHREKPSEWLI